MTPKSLVIDGEEAQSLFAMQQPFTGKMPSARFTCADFGWSIGETEKCTVVVAKKLPMFADFRNIRSHSFFNEREPPTSISIPLGQLRIENVQEMHRTLTNTCPSARQLVMASSLYFLKHDELLFRDWILSRSRGDNDEIVLVGSSYKHERLTIDIILIPEINLSGLSAAYKLV